MTSTLPQIVVVEDEADLRRDLVEFLRLRSFAVTACASAEAFLSLPSSTQMDLVLLDLGLPEKDGLTLLREMKSKPSCPPVIVLTALGTDEDHLRGLSAGADAYVVKNRSLPVIEATCRAVIKRHLAASQAPRWRFHAHAAAIEAPDGTSITLTHQEATFLQCVVREAGQVVTRERILSALDKSDTLSNLRNLDTCIARLRRKILAEAKVELPVRSAYGEGYVFHGKIED